MFSINGFGNNTRQNWNETALKRGPLDSGNFGSS